MGGSSRSSRSSSTTYKVTNRNLALGNGAKGNIQISGDGNTITDGGAFELVGDVANRAFDSLDRSHQTNSDFLLQAGGAVIDTVRGNAEDQMDFFLQAGGAVIDTVRGNAEDQMDFNKDMLGAMQNSANSRGSELRALSESLATGASSSTVKTIIIGAVVIVVGGGFFLFKKR